MLVTVLDAAGAEHTVVWQGQDQINDFSGNLTAGAVGPEPAPQQVAPANALRAGFLFQNTSPRPMLLLEVNGLASTSAFVVNSGEYFPPLPGYPIPTGIIQVLGTAESEQGDTFAYREWQSAPGE